MACQKDNDNFVTASSSTQFSNFIKTAENGSNSQN